MHMRRSCGAGVLPQRPQRNLTPHCRAPKAHRGASHSRHARAVARARHGGRKGHARQALYGPLGRARPTWRTRYRLPGRERWSNYLSRAQAVRQPRCPCWTTCPTVATPSLEQCAQCPPRPPLPCPPTHPTSGEGRPKRGATCNPQVGHPLRCGRHARAFHSSSPGYCSADLLLSLFQRVRHHCRQRYGLTKSAFHPLVARSASTNHLVDTKVGA